MPAHLDFQELVSQLHTAGLDSTEAVCVELASM